MVGFLTEFMILHPLIIYRATLRNWSILGLYVLLVFFVKMLTMQLPYYTNFRSESRQIDRILPLVDE